MISGSQPFELFRIYFAVIMILSITSDGKNIGCNFPPSLWCSDPLISQRCEVEQQCADWRTQVKDASPVNVTLYFESLCSDCRHFMKDMLYPTWKTLESTGIMNLDLVPYGNARETKVGDQWIFTCQVGPRECYGNLLETCTLHYEPFSTAYEIIHCAEVADFPTVEFRTCAAEYGANFTQINECAQGDLGNELEHAMALRTDALQPPHEYVPWVTINGVHTEDMEKLAEKDLLSLVCSTYQGPPPEQCNAQKQQQRSDIMGKF